MILPPFDPPRFDVMSKWWRRCTYADVHLLILEVLHLRLTLRELSAHANDASRAVLNLDPSMMNHGAPLRRLKWQIDKEMQRAGPLGNSRMAVVPFSDEWRARQAAQCNPRAVPDEFDPGSDKATQLPDFQRPSWSELREVWRRSGYTGKGPMKLEQRLVLEIVSVRRALRKIEKIVGTTDGDLGDSAGTNSFRLARLRAFVDDLHID